MLTSAQIRQRADASCFSKSFYRVDVTLNYITSSLALFTDYDNKDSTIYESCSSLNNLIQKIIPPFQRDNNQWNMDMKRKFVENVLSGFVCDILLFRVGDKYSNAKILDGLQRLTALGDFFSGKVSVFDNTTMEEIEKSNILKAARLGIKVYDFKDEVEAIKFYIDMNENITHSPSDIAKAKKYALDKFGVKI